MKERDILTLNELKNKTLKEIYEYAKTYEIPYYSQMNKKELAHAVIKAHEKQKGFYTAEGALEIMANQEFGFYVPLITAKAKKTSISLIPKSSVLA